VQRHAFVLRACVPLAPVSRIPNMTKADALYLMVGVALLTFGLWFLMFGVGL
jgi:hypothetical protein